MFSDVGWRRKEGDVLFNDTLIAFHLQSYGVGHIVKDHLISSKGSFICPIPHPTAFVPSTGRSKE